MIHQLGTHAGKQIAFGFDRYLLPELDDYLDIISRYGSVVEDVDAEFLHYLTSAQRVCQRVQGAVDRVGILCCGTGMGMSIAANKFRGIYASRCITAEDANLSRVINNSNMLCIASNSGIALNADIIDTFMRTSFEGRKLDELEYIAQFELEQNPAPAIAAHSFPKVLRRTA